MRLYEIDESIQKLLDMQYENNLTDEEIQDTLNALLMDKHDKCVNVALAIKNLKKDIDKFKEEEDRLSKRRKSMDNQLSWLKEYLACSLNGEKLQDDPRVSVHWSKSKQVIIDDPSALPSAYLIPQDDKIDKVGIKEAIEKGANIEGAHIAEKEFVVVK